MLETLKNLSKNEMITLDDEQAHRFTSREDYEISEVRHLQGEDGECVIIELTADYYIICHNFQGDDLCYLLEMNSKEDYKDVDEIEISRNSEQSFYILDSDKWICNDGNAEIEIQIFTNKDEFLDQAIQAVNSDVATIYVGFEIEEDSIVI